MHSRSPRATPGRPLKTRTACVPDLRLAALAFLAAAVLILSFAAAAKAQTSFTVEGGSFSIAVPPDWVPIPALELYLFEHHGHTGPVPPEELAEFRKSRMGFQRPDPNGKWFTLPYMVISVESGRKRTAQDLFMESVMAEKDSEAAASPEGYRFLEKEHQPMKRLTYYKDVSFSAAQGKNVAMGVYTYLTSQGFLRVAWFAAEDELRALESDLHRSAMSVRLSPELEYKPEKKK